MKTRLFSYGVALTLISTQVSAQYLKTDAFPNPHSISDLGQIAGFDAQTGPYYIWTPEADEIENIGGVAPGNGYGGVASFSYDGKFLSGTSKNAENGNIAEMSRYNTETKTWQTLGGLGMGSDAVSISSGYYISGDGKNVVGLAYNPSKKAVGFVWNETKGAIGLPTANPERNARANAVSADGNIIVGWRDTNGPWKAAVWRKDANGDFLANKFLLINPNGSENDQMNQLAEARAISGNGKWIGGKSDFAFPNAWIWSEATGVIDLGTLTTDPGTTSWVTSFNYDGSIVMGYTITKDGPFAPAIYRPWIWTAKNGMRNLNDFVTNVLGFDMKGDQIFVPTQISSNSKYITGWAFPASTADKIRVFRIELPDNFLATSEPTQTEATKLYPNPVNDVLNIDSKTIIDNVSIYNMAGQIISSTKTNSKTVKVDASKFKTGVYIVKVNSGSESKTYKMIKK